MESAWPTPLPEPCSGPCPPCLCPRGSATRSVGPVSPGAPFLHALGEGQGPPGPRHSDPGVCDGSRWQHLWPGTRWNPHTGRGGGRRGLSQGDPGLPSPTQAQPYVSSPGTEVPDALCLASSSLSAPTGARPTLHAGPLGAGWTATREQGSAPTGASVPGLSPWLLSCGRETVCHTEGRRRWEREGMGWPPGPHGDSCLASAWF